MSWSPAIGAMTLERRLGNGPAVDALVVLLSGAVTSEALVSGTYREVLTDIGDGHASALMEDPSGARLVYWPRVWAARALAYIGDMSVGDDLIRASGDEHWRVRMTVIKTLGRLGVETAQPQLLTALDDGHPRVRSAAVVALGRVGDEGAIPPLNHHRDGPVGSAAIDLALSKIVRRTGG